MCSIIGSMEQYVLCPTEPTWRTETLQTTHKFCRLLRHIGRQQKETSTGKESAMSSEQIPITKAE